MKKLLLLFVRPQGGDGEDASPRPRDSDPLLSIGPEAAALRVKKRFELK